MFYTEVMTNPHLDPLHEAITCLDAAWADAAAAGDLTRAQLIAANDALGLARRRLDALHTEIAAGIAHESRPDLGPESLAKQHGFRSPAQLIAATTGGSAGDASRLVKVGESTRERTDLLGTALPSKYPVVRSALDRGAVSAQIAAMIIALLDRARVKVSHDRIADAERLLIERAPGLSIDDMRRLIVRAEAWLDPDGIRPREEECRSRRSLTMFERDGMLHLNAVLDAESAAPVKAAIRGYVTAAFAARKDQLRDGGENSDARENSGGVETAGSPKAGDDPDADRRTVPMIQADALATLCGHALECDAEHLPLAGATVIVRLTLDDLIAGDGVATIDGTDQPISVSAARRMAAGGTVIPWVMGGESEVLDWGRGRRLFTKAQRRALTERDGGCAMCSLPPEMTKVHHIRWWERDAGPTDLDNGILLCETCHHRIHDNGWDIRIDGTGVAARVWFLPPPFIDPDRTPRLGGRARFDMVA